MVSSHNIAMSLVSLLEGGSAPEVVAEKFVQYVKKFQLVERVPQILAALEVVSAERADVLLVEASREPSGEVLSILRERLGVEGSVNANVVIDDTMTGGVRATYGDKHLDASIDTKLKKLQVAMRQ